jgi:hypothetical protein
MKDPFTGKERKEASPPVYTESQMRRIDNAWFRETEVLKKALEECQKELALLKDTLK